MHFPLGRWGYYAAANLPFYFFILFRKLLKYLHTVFWMNDYYERTKLWMLPLFLSI